MNIVFVILTLAGAGCLAWGIVAPNSQFAVAGVVLLAVAILLARFFRSD